MFQWIERHIGWLLGFGAVVVVAIHLLTVGEYPPAWFDEIEIIEMGRFSVFDVHPAWSVNLLADPNGVLQPPVPLFHYLAGALLEFLYRLTDGFVCGRTFMLFSLPACALMMFQWLKVEGFSSVVAGLTAFLFLFDPNATICAHWYRPDLWCMAITFGAMILISRADGSRRSTLCLVLAGGLMAVSVFFWITSILFLPLVFLSLIRRKNGRVGGFVKVGLGGLVLSSLILLPLYGYVPEIVNQYLCHSEIGSMGRMGPGLTSKCLANFIELVKIAARSPFVWLMAVAGIFFGRCRQPHVVCFLGLVAFMIATKVYHLRMVYLMPWLFLFVAETVRTVLLVSGEGLRKLAVIGVGLSIAGECLISVVFVNYAAWPERNTLSAFVEQLHKAVPGPDADVYLMDMEHELYYAGRRLGWRMYSATSRKDVLNGKNAELLSKLDAVVVTELGPQLDTRDREVLDASGFTPTSVFKMPPAATGALKSKIASVIYAHGYPACTVWTRQ